MRVPVGPFEYQVILVKGYIDFDGEPCLGLCDNETHRLLISDQCGDAQRLHVLCHEYFEAWVYHFGEGLAARDKERVCDLFGLAMTQLLRDTLSRLGRGEVPLVDGDASAVFCLATADEHDTPPHTSTPQAPAAVKVWKVSDQVWPPPDQGTAAWRVRVYDKRPD